MHEAPATTVQLVPSAAVAAFVACSRGGADTTLSLLIIKAGIVDTPAVLLIFCIEHLQLLSPLQLLLLLEQLVALVQTRLCLFS